MDLGRAFSFVFDDPEWVKKILIGGLVSLAGFVIPLLPAFVIYGYTLEVLRRVYLGQAEELPEWNDIGGYLVQGAVLAAGVFIWLIPPMLLIGCVAGGILIAGSSSGNDAVAAFSGLLALGVMGIVFILLILWSVAILPIIAGRYAVEQRFGSMFEFSEILKEIRVAGAGPILVLLLTVIVAGFIGQLGFIACFIGVVFTSFYSYVVIAHGAGQVYRRARGFDDTPALPPSPAV